MPTYKYKCGSCENSFELFSRIKDHKTTAECTECGHDATQVISAPMLIIRPDIAYDSPIDGTIITNSRQRREDLARNGCIEYEPGIRQDADKKVLNDELALDKAVDETIDREIALMPVKKRERLENEMLTGLTAEAIRV